jgi:hypothetical protein
VCVCCVVVDCATSVRVKRDSAPLGGALQVFSQQRAAILTWQHSHAPLGAANDPRGEGAERARVSSNREGQNEAVACRPELASLARLHLSTPGARACPKYRLTGDGAPWRPPSAILCGAGEACQLLRPFFFVLSPSPRSAAFFPLFEACILTTRPSQFPSPLPDADCTHNCRQLEVRRLSQKCNP